MAIRYTDGNLVLIVERTCDSAVLERRRMLQADDVVSSQDG